MTDLLTNKISAVRVSKTSLKRWTLYGAVDQALKTSCQADAVRVIPIHFDVDDQPLQAELWINVQPRLAADEEPNPGADVICQQQRLRDKGLSLAEVALLGAGDVVSDLDSVKGVAILTGPGGSDFAPGFDDDLTKVFAVMLGADDGNAILLEDDDENPH